MLTLDTPIINVNRVGQTTAKRLVKIGILTVRDLLFYFPYRYDDYRHISKIDKLIPGTSANIIGQIQLLQNRRAHRRRMYITEALVADETDSIKVIWFNQPFIVKNLKVGDRISLAGKVTGTNFDKTLVSPIYEKSTSNSQLHTNRLVPNYHLTANITQKQIRFLIGQNSALEYLVPKAIKELQKNLFIETEYYEGDLFCSLLKINNEPNYWLSHEKEKQELINLYNEQKKMLGILDLTENTIVKIKEAYNEFIQ